MDGPLSRLRAARDLQQIEAAWNATRLQPLRDAAKAILLNPVLPGEMVVRLFTGDLCTINIRDEVGQELLVYGMIEPDLTEFELLALGSGQVVYDVGAHIGFHTLVAASVVGLTGRVVAIEPTPSTHALLKKNTGHLRQVETISAAAGAHSSEVPFHDFGTEKAAFNSLKGIRDHSGTASGQVINVEQVRLDDIWRATNADPSFVKIDVESSEADVIAGMSCVLAACRPVVALEVGDFAHLQAQGIPDAIQLINMMGSLEYRPFDLRSGRLFPHKVLAEGTYPYMNLIFLPIEGNCIGQSLVDDE